MPEAKVWKFGNKWAGIGSRGKRVVEKTKAAARKAVGLDKKTKAKPKTKAKKKSNRKTTKKKGGRKVARGFRTQKIFSLLRVASLLLPALHSLMQTDASLQQRITWILGKYTGYDVDTGQFNLHNLQKGWAPFLVTSVVTYGIPKLTGMIRKIM